MWLETRKEAREACGLRTEVAEGPNNQDPVRVETKQVVLGWIQRGRFNQLENKGYYGWITFPSEEQLWGWEREAHISLF